jgi:hypothetical protein
MKEYSGLDIILQARSSVKSHLIPIEDEKDAKLTVSWRYQRLTGKHKTRFKCFPHSAELHLTLNRIWRINVFKPMV